MKTLTSLTPQQLAELLAFQRSSPQQTTTYLDPSNPSQKSIIQIALQSADRTDPDYPMLFAALNSPQAPVGPGNTISVSIADAGKTKDGKAAATVWAISTAGDTVFSGGSLLLFDKDSGALLAQGDNTAVKTGFLACSIDPNVTSPAGRALSLLYIGHTTNDDNSVNFIAFASDVAVSDPIPITITHPAYQYNPPLHTDIEIGVGRTVYTGFNLDYYYVESVNEGYSPYLVVPFVGNAQLQGTVNLSAITIANLLTYVYIDPITNPPSARAVQYTTDAKMLSALSVGTPPNILSWNFPYDNLGHANTNSIVYNPISLLQEFEAYFYFVFLNIPTSNGSVTFYVCSESTPGEPSVNCKKIPNLWFLWHCVAKGTLVTLEDGTKKPIEELTQEFRVKTSDGSLAIYATALGRHRNVKGGKEIFKIVTANNKSVITTDGHVVFISKDKLRKVSDLKPGDAILTEDGASTVKSVEAIEYEDMFYSLVIGNFDEKKAKSFPHNNAGYYAGGILCADHQATRHHHKKLRSDPEYVLPRLKRELQQDYMSALKQKRY